jgi:hypothetical protein
MTGGMRAGKAHALAVVVGFVTLLASAGAARAAVTVTAEKASYGERDGNAAFALARENVLQFGATATVQLAGGGGAAAGCPADAKLDDDATPCEATVPFGVLAPTARVPVTLIDDNIDEADAETLQLTVTKATEGVGSPASATTAIADDDASPVLSIDDAKRVVEGDTPGAVLEFPLTLSAVSGRAVTATVTSGGSAKAGDDVAKLGFTDTVTIPAGATKGTLKLSVLADDLDEPDEEATLTLSQPSGATLGRATGKGTVLDDDLPAMAVTDVVGPEGSNGGRTPFTFTVTLSNASVRTIAATFGTQDLQAKAGADYDPVLTQVSFPPGSTSQPVTVGVVADSAIESNEAFAVSLTDPSGATLATAGALGGILDDDRLRGASVTPAAAVASVLPKLRGPAGNVRLARLAFKKPGTMSGVVRCPAGGARCRGSMTLFSVPQRKSRVKQLRNELKLGKASFVVAAGGQRAVSLRIGKKQLAWLRKAGGVRVRAYVVSHTPAGEVSTARADAVVKA